MKMYRVSHKVTARGVYSHNNYCYHNGLEKYMNVYLDDMEALHSNSKNQKRTPCRLDDTILETDGMLEKDFIYGFESVEAMCRWFSRAELELLYESGFHIIVVDVMEYIRYKRQMVTTKSCFINTEVKDLLSLKDFI